MAVSQKQLERIRDELLELGNDPDEIAASLEARGCVGRRRDGEDCVLARLLKDTVPGEPIVVSHSVINIGDACLFIECPGNQSWLEEAEEERLPRSFWDFIDRHDRFLYPKLVDPDYGDDDPDEDFDNDVDDDDDFDDDLDDLDDDEIEGEEEEEEDDDY